MRCCVASTTLTNGAGGVPRTIYKQINPLKRYDISLLAIVEHVHHVAVIALSNLPRIRSPCTPSAYLKVY